MAEPNDVFVFFVNGRRYEHQLPEITGKEVRNAADIVAEQVLYLEEHGAGSDRAVEGGEIFKLEKHVPHFFSEEGHRRQTFYLFSVDAKWYESERDALTGAEIKRRAEAEAKYQLFLEEEGDAPDRLVPDDHTEILSGTIKRFYLVPPATFGAN